MAISLYDITVPSYLQTLGAISGLLSKAQTHCTECKTELSDIISTRLFPDMLPFSYQVMAATHHSLGALQSLEKGVFSPDRSPPPTEFAALQTAVADTIAALKDIQPAAINAYEGRDMAFEMPNMKIPFTAENFLMSFSLPNFYFHAATAYDILRMKGVALGKRDFMGHLRMKR